MPVLPELDPHPHARAVLGAALPPAGEPSHAYLLHGPAGAGKRAAARAFAAALLAEGADDPQNAEERALRGTHPDLTWVKPSGAAEMLVSDIDEDVVAAAYKTPFEARRRVFVIDGAEAMNDQAANRMLKTLEEPLPFVTLLLISDRPQDMLPTIVSRCLAVRFDRLPSATLAERLASEGQDPDQALACARLAEGEESLARELISPEGSELRALAQNLASQALADEGLQGRPWLELLEAAREHGVQAGELMQEQAAEQLEFVPAKERKRVEREVTESRRRVERRARTRTLDLGLRLVELWLRDLVCVAEGAPDLILAVDRKEELTEQAQTLDAARLRAAVALTSETRLALTLNVSEELAADALFYSLAAPIA